MGITSQIISSINCHPQLFIWSYFVDSNNVNNPESLTSRKWQPGSVHSISSIWQPGSGSEEGELTRAGEEGSVESAYLESST